MRKSDVKYIIIHCSASRENVDYGAEALERDHIARGFRKGAYHYYILKNGMVHSFRKEHEMGAHCKGFNRISIGVCYEGGLDTEGNPKDTRTLAQKDTMFYLIKMLSCKYPNAQIVGHRDLSKDIDGDGKISKYEWMKACPSFDAKDEYKDIRKRTWTKRLKTNID